MRNHESQSIRRNPSWRWQRAGQFIENPGIETRPTVRRDGKESISAIRKAIKFRAAMDSCDTEYAKTELSLKHPDIFWAHELWVAEDPMRYSVEAYLLARETDKEIGFRCGCSPSVVAAYEQYFFNVRERLRNQNYIVNVVLGESIHKGLADRHYDLLWKLSGYMLGPYALDMAITKFPAMSWAAGPDAVSAAWQDAAIGVMKMKASQAAIALSVNQQTNLAILDIFNKYVEVERTTQNQGQAKEAILENLTATLRALPFSVASPGVAQPNKHALITYNPNGGELRYEEHMLLAAGITPPTLPLLASMDFPEEPQ